jgi:prepilin-type N-terminal cleavage/methylation domain-containing protein
MVWLTEEEHFMRGLKNKKHLSSEEGFTLVEVVIGMVLMAVVFTAAYGSYFLGMRIIQDAREEVRAHQIIQSELERLRTKNWNQLGELGATSLFTPQGNFVQKYADQYTAYRLVRDVSGKPQKYVIIIVLWKKSHGEDGKAVFNTIFTEGGLNDYYYRDI